MASRGLSRSYCEAKASLGEEPVSRVEGIGAAIVDVWV